MHLLAAKISASISGIIFFDKNGNEIPQQWESIIKLESYLSGNKNETTYTKMEADNLHSRHLSEGNYSVTQVYPDSWLQIISCFPALYYPVSTGKNIRYYFPEIFHLRNNCRKRL